MKIKYNLRFSLAFIAKLTAAVLVFLLSLLIMPFYIGGDQVNYRIVYEALPDLDLTEGFLFYYRYTTSTEYVHFYLSWLASRFIEKDIFIAFANAIFAYVAMSLFLKWKVSVVIAFLLVITNYYFFVLYFAAERLKFGFIFLALSLTHIDQVKRFYGFAVLAVISHIQVLIAYGTILFNFIVRRMLKLFRTLKGSKSLFLVPLLFIPLLLVEDQIIYKFQSYYRERPLADLAKVFMFLLLALCYSNKKSNTVMMFVPVIIAVFLVGGDRVNVFGYFIFLYYALQFRGGWNFGVFATSLYFAYATINFVINVIQGGEGFSA